MKRALFGSLSHLAPTTVLRLLATATPTGILELITDAGSLRLEIVEGRVTTVSDEELRRAGRVLECSAGSFRFEPGEMAPLTTDTLALTAFAEAAQAWVHRSRRSPSSDADLERLLAETGPPVESDDEGATIHVLSGTPPENPLDELLSDLEATAPDELLFAQVGVVASDPRQWRGSLETEWRRRGWKLKLFGTTGRIPFDELDVIVVHHRLSITRVGQESDWIELVEQANSRNPSVPVIWIGPLGDPVWVHRLIAAGVVFLMPPPAGDSGDTQHRFVESIGAVVDRQLRLRQGARPSDLPTAVSDLVDALLHDADSEQAVGSLLQITAGQLGRGAVLMVEDTAIRCRAGYGFPLSRGVVTLPRGLGLVERVVRSGEAVFEIEPISAGARELARVLGVDRMTRETAVIPLGTGAPVDGILVADREGQPLPDLGELVLLAQRLGGAVVRV